MSISKRPEPMSELPKCKICGNYPVNYHAGEFGIKHHCVDKHCTLCNVLFTSDQWRTLMEKKDRVLLHAIFDMCENTEENTKPDTDFDKGRIFEAKHIRKAIGTLYQDMGGN